MKNEIVEVGDLVVSKAGRDKDSIYLVFAKISEDFVLLVDGNHKKLDNPKLKKIKHVKSLNIRAEKLADKIKHDIKIFDEEVFSAIKNKI